MVLSLFLAFAGIFFSCAARSAPPEAAPAAAASAGYDRTLTGYEYPYPVEKFSFQAQGQALEMAYMDVMPAGGQRGTVLLLHGKNFSGAYWARTMEALRAAGYRVIVPDQVGFGKSSKPLDFQYSLHQLALLTRELLRHRGVNEAAVVGHSMGGMLAARFALEYPEATSRLALVNPIGLEDWQRIAPYRGIDAAFQQELQRTPASTKAYMQESYFAGQWKPAYDPLLDIQAGWSVGPDREHMARIAALTQDMILTQPVLYEFQDIRVRTLLIIGQRDRTAIGKADVSPDVAATMGDYRALGQRAAAAIPGARLVALDDVGHVPQFEAFDRYIAALQGFLAEP